MTGWEAKQYAGAAVWSVILVAAFVMFVWLFFPSAHWTETVTCADPKHRTDQRYDKPGRDCPPYMRRRWPNAPTAPTLEPVK